MRRSWFDRFFRDEYDEEYEDDEGTAAPSAPLEPPLIRQRTAPPLEEDRPAAPALEAPPPRPAPEPAYEPPSPTSVRAVGEWAGAETAAQLNELPPAARERTAEALLLWHETEVQLAQSLKRAQAIAEQSERLLSTSLSDPGFAADAEHLKQGTEMQGAALQALLEGNRSRAREWVLSALLGQKDWTPARVIRLYARTGLGPLTLADLQPRLRSMDVGPRTWAAEALGELTDAESGQALLNLLRDPDAGVRAAAIAALGKKADPTLLHALGNVIKRDPDWFVRLRAIHAAQSVEGYEAIGFLHELLRDAGWWRELQVLHSVGAANAPADGSGSYEKVRTGVVNSLLAKVQAMLPSADPPHRAWLMEVLGDTGDTRAVPLLSSALQDAELDVRLKAIRGLGRIGGASIVDLITPALKDQQSQVRIQAAEAMGDAGDFRAIEPLVSALADGNEFVRAAITVAIGKIVDTKALGPLVAALNDPDKEARDQMHLALQKMSDPRTMNLLNAMLEAGGVRKRPGG
jgi:hypothetical protein